MKSEAKRQFNIRLPKAMIDKLEAMGAPGESATSLGARAIEEWVRMMEMPGIDFRMTPTGRQPHVTGTGLTVWELFMVYSDHAGDARKVLRNYPHLKRHQKHLSRLSHLSHQYQYQYQYQSLMILLHL